MAYTIEYQGKKTYLRMGKKYFAGTQRVKHFQTMWFNYKAVSCVYNFVTTGGKSISLNVKVRCRFWFFTSLAGLCRDAFNFVGLKVLSNVLTFSHACSAPFRAFYYISWCFKATNYYRAQNQLRNDLLNDFKWLLTVPSRCYGFNREIKIRRRICVVRAIFECRTEY